MYLEMLLLFIEQSLMPQTFKLCKAYP